MSEVIIRSVTGGKIDLANFKPANVEIEAIARGLSNVCRFAGQLRGFYSVAQHSVHVADLLFTQGETGMEGRRLAQIGLLHDASEAYIGDVSRNLKTSGYMTGYRVLEEEVQNACFDAFGLSEISDLDYHRVKAADDLLAIFERVVVRDRLKWERPHDEVERAFEDGYVAYTRADSILALLPSFEIVSEDFSAWTCSLAYEKFSHSWDYYFGS